MSPKSKKPYKKAYLEITNVCNLSCAFCPKTSREPRFVSVEEFSSLIEQVQPLTDYVYLHLMGEPLLHCIRRPAGERGRSWRPGI